MKITIISLCCILFATTANAGTSKVKLNVAPLPPQLSATVAFSEPSGNRLLDADETGKLVVTVKNSGKGDAFDVKVAITPDKRLSGLSIPREAEIGTVAAGQEVKTEIPLVAGEDLSEGKVALDLSFTESNGFDPQPLKLTFGTRPFEPPKLLVADLGIADASGNGRIEPGEIVEVTARVQNGGHGDARQVLADVKLGANVFLAADSQSSFELGAIPSGEFRDVKFSFYTNNRIKNGEKIPVSLALREGRPRFSTDQQLALTMNAQQKRAEEIVVEGAKPVRRDDIQMAGGLSVDVESGIPEGEKGDRYDVAVVIGNRTYSGTVPAVEFASRDAKIMKEYLERTLGYLPENIIYAEDATLSKLNEIFGNDRDYKGKLFKYVKPQQSRVFVYYAGHGAPDIESGDAYIVPVDADPQYLKANGYRLKTFYDNLAKIQAKSMTVVLDACFSGNTPKGLLFKGISPLVLNAKDVSGGPTGATLFSSASADQVSSWYPDKKHSLFTYFFLKGLQGEADANHDGKITVNEMESYLKEQVPYMVRRITGTEQLPTVTGKGAEVLAVLKR